MVDKLKRALDGLETPICPNCHVEMKWTQSALVAADTISHLFHCPACHRAGETSSKVRVELIPPKKLSAPLSRLVA